MIFNLLGKCFGLAGGAARVGRLKLVGVTSWSSKLEFESGGGKAAGQWPRRSDHLRFLVRVTSCVIFKTARLSSMVVLVDSVERLSPMRAASLCPA